MERDQLRVKIVGDEIIVNTGPFDASVHINAEKFIELLDKEFVLKSFEKKPKLEIKNEKKVEIKS